MTFEGSYKAPDNSDVLPITHRSFDNDAIMFTDTPGSTLTLRGASRATASRSTLRALSTSACGLPPTTLRLWRSSHWTGHTTMDTEDDVFEHKVNTITLAPGETDVRSFSVTLL